jgi:hypothetical protein
MKQIDLSGLSNLGGTPHPSEPDDKAGPVAAAFGVVLGVCATVAVIMLTVKLGLVLFT